MGLEKATNLDTLFAEIGERIAENTTVDGDYIAIPIKAKMVAAELEPLKRIVEAASKNTTDGRDIWSHGSRCPYENGNRNLCDCGLTDLRGALAALGKVGEESSNG